MIQQRVTVGAGPLATMVHSLELLQMQKRSERQVLYIDCINKSIQNQILQKLSDQNRFEFIIIISVVPHARWRGTFI